MQFRKHLSMLKLARGYRRHCPTLMSLKTTVDTFNAAEAQGTEPWGANETRRRKYQAVSLKQRNSFRSAPNFPSTQKQQQSVVNRAPEIIPNGTVYSMTSTRYIAWNLVCINTPFHLRVTFAHDPALTSPRVVLFRHEILSSVYGSTRQEHDLTETPRSAFRKARRDV